MRSAWADTPRHLRDAFVCDVIAVLEGALPLPDHAHAAAGSIVLRITSAPDREVVAAASTRCISARGVINPERARPVPLVSVTRDIRLFAQAFAALSSRDRSRIAAIVRTILQANTESGNARGREESGGERDAFPWLLEARQFLHERYLGTVRMRDIADAVGRHHVHVSRAFAQAFGVTMSDYMRDLRLARACELLLTSSHQLSRIAHSIGFSDHAHFTRVFTAVLGTTPSRYRSANSALAGARPPLYLYRSEPELPGDSCADRGGRSRVAFATSRNIVGHAAG